MAKKTDLSLPDRLASSRRAEEPSITERVAEVLSQRISDGLFSEGDRLPSSRNLAQEFDTSINTVQAALGRLEARGLITCQPRRRAVVGSTIGHESAITKHGLIMLITEPGAYYSEYGKSWGAQIMLAAQHILAEQNLSVATMYIPTVKQRVPDEVMQRTETLMRQAMGIIWLAASQTQPLMLKAIRRGTPVVSVNATQDITPHNMVSADNAAGGRIIGEVFAKLGYDRCLLLTSGIRMRRLSPDLAQGFVYSYMKEGLPLNGIDYRDVPGNDIDLAQKEVEAYLDENPPPRGIFAVRDRIAVGAIRALKARGLSVPKDVGVISGVGSSECVQHQPPITSWRQPTKQLGEEAAAMMLKLLENPTQHWPAIMVPSVIEMRETLPAASWYKDMPGLDLEPTNIY